MDRNLVRLRVPTSNTSRSTNGLPTIFVVTSHMRVDLLTSGVTCASLLAFQLSF